MRASPSPARGTDAVRARINKLHDLVLCTDQAECDRLEVVIQKLEADAKLPGGETVSEAAD
jgi:hypothetical protein